MYRRTRVARRHRRTRKRTRHVFGKKAVRAIKKIASKEVETKWHILNSDLLVDIPPVSWSTSGGVGSGMAFIRNLFQYIPRTNNAGSESRSEVVGSEFRVVGIRLSGLVGWRPVTSTGFIGEMRVRITVLRVTEYYDQGYFGLYSGAGNWFEDDDSLPITYRRFNMDRVHILKSKVLTLGGQNGQPIRSWKMWLPMRRKKLQCYDDEGTNVAVSQLVGRLKDFNYYVLVETLSPLGYQWDTSRDFMRFQTQVYFKDA